MGGNVVERSDGGDHYKSGGNWTLLQTAGRFQLALIAITKTEEAPSEDRSSLYEETWISQPYVFL